MIQLYDNLLFAATVLLWAFISVFFHEVGHYLVAYHYGFNPRFDYSLRPLIVMVRVQYPHISTHEQFLKTRKESVNVSLGGILGISPYVIGLLYFPVVASFTWLGFIILMISYTVFETIMINNKFKLKWDE